MKGVCEGRRERNEPNQGFTDMTSFWLLKYKQQFAGQPGKGPSDQRAEPVGGVHMNPGVCVCVDWQETKQRAEAGCGLVTGSLGLPAKEDAFDSVSPEGDKARLKEVGDLI